MKATIMNNFTKLLCESGFPYSVQEQKDVIRISLQGTPFSFELYAERQQKSKCLGKDVLVRIPEHMVFHNGSESMSIPCNYIADAIMSTVGQYAQRTKAS